MRAFGSQGMREELDWVVEERNQQRNSRTELGLKPHESVFRASSLTSKLARAKAGLSAIMMKKEEILSSNGAPMPGHLQKVLGLVGVGGTRARP